MKTIGYMLLIYDTRTNYWKPISPDPWTFSKTVANQMLTKFEIQDKENKYKVAEVKIHH